MAQNIQRDPVMCNYKEPWHAIKDCRKSEYPETSKISKTQPIIRWTEDFGGNLHRCIGVRHILLEYAIRGNETVLAACPVLSNDQPYSTDNISLEGDLINRASHTHGLLLGDSVDVYYKIEEATRGTSYCDSIKPY